MASALSDKLSRLVKQMRGQARITEDNVQEMLREVRMALLEADVALPVVRDFVARVKEKALGKEVVGSLNPGQALVGIVHRELVATMGAGVSDINLAAQPPAVILMAGLQGAGKTTTTAKLAKHLIEKRRKKVLTVSGDVYRPAVSTSSTSKYCLRAKSSAARAMSTGFWSGALGNHSAPACFVTVLSCSMAAGR